jgi:hypothetical protein
VTLRNSSDHQIFDAVNHHGMYSLFVGRVVVAVGVGNEIVVNECGFIVNLVAQRAIRYTVDVNIKKGRWQSLSIW